MCLFSFDKEKYEKTIKKEGKDEGRKEGEFNTTYNFIKQGLITIDQAATAMGVNYQATVRQFQKIQSCFIIYYLLLITYYYNNNSKFNKKNTRCLTDHIFFEN